MSEMLEWAENEIELAKKAFNKDDVEYDYAIMCMDSAIKAYKSLMEDGHSGYSIGVTKTILNALIDGVPLTAIEDTDDIWNKIDDGMYQCKRMSSLFKDVSEDGAITYKDIHRVVCIDANSGASYSFGLAHNYLDSLYPITMPYNPKREKYKIFCEDFLYKDPGEETHEDFNRFAMLYMIEPGGNRVEIGKYYKESKDQGMVEISKEEYMKDKEETLRNA